MRIISEAEDSKYAVVLLGGSIGSKPIRSTRELKGMEVIDPNSVSSKEKAKENAKKMNSYLSPGEKKYYGLKYVVAEVENGKYTGR